MKKVIKKEFSMIARYGCLFHEARIYIYIFAILVFFSSFAIASQDNPLTLTDRFHRVEASYQLSQIHSLQKETKVILQNLLLSGDFSLTPQMSLLGRIPFITLSNEVAIANPFLGLQGKLFEGLVKDFPTFVFLKGGVKLPLRSDYEFVFPRTDVLLNLFTLREVHHLSLLTDISYIIKVDPDTREKSYGNEWSCIVGGEIETGYDVSGGIHLNYIRAGDYRQNQMPRIPGRSILILKPFFSYHYDRDTTVKASLAFPLSRYGFKDILKVFGDYTIAGLNGNTFHLLFEKKF